ncbi:MAG: alanine racemase [Candidatus Velthaea sp.]|jgi:alanine racemase
MLARLEIDLDAIRTNRATLAALVEPTRVAAVIKANAYGHGLRETGTALDGLASRLCVYSLEEAVALREAGVRGRIQVLGPIDAAGLDAAHAAGVELTIWDRGAYAAGVAQVARRRNAPFAVHLKIDTGVTRLGITAERAKPALAQWLATPEFRVAGLMSHLAAAEELDSTYTQEQLARFHAAVDGIDPALERHIAASAAAMLWPRTRLDLVRAGIALYGLWPSEPTRRIMEARGVSLVPALAWRTELVALHDVPAETSIGYGVTYRTTRASRIGILPIGYAEGIPRARSNRGEVLVAGKRAPLVGRVCMNMTFVDVTGIPDAHVGTRVTLIGDDGQERITAEAFADWSDSINYELVARLPVEVPRRFGVSVRAQR